MRSAMIGSCFAQICQIAGTDLGSVSLGQKCGLHQITHELGVRDWAPAPNTAETS